MNLEIITKKDLQEMEKSLMEKVSNLFEGKVKEEKWLKSIHVSEIFGISSSRLSYLRNSKEIPHYKLGGEYVYKMSELVQWIEEGRVA
jgi:hypothetical protein